MNIVRKLFKNTTPSKPKRTADSFDPWYEWDIDEGKVRNLVKVRIRYVGNVNPLSPDLDDLLRDIVNTEDQWEAMRTIWTEEAEKFLTEG